MAQSQPRHKSRHNILYCNFTRQIIVNFIDSMFTAAVSLQRSCTIKLMMYKLFLQLTCKVDERIASSNVDDMQVMRKRLVRFHPNTKTNETCATHLQPITKNCTCCIRHQCSKQNKRFVAFRSS